MGNPVNPTPQPRRDITLGTETLEWPLRLETATVILEAVNEEGQRVRLRTKLAFPHPNSAAITEISKITDTFVTLVGSSEFHLDVHGRMIPDPATGSVYTIEVL